MIGSLRPASAPAALDFRRAQRSRLPPICGVTSSTVEVKLHLTSIGSLCRLRGISYEAPLHPSFESLACLEPHALLGIGDGITPECSLLTTRAASMYEQAAAAAAVRTHLIECREASAFNVVQSRISIASAPACLSGYVRSRNIQDLEFEAR